ncbi:MAG: thioredoxin-disulfide reductase [Alphaproteobacteria bacterium]|nr:thioredoxin-disulfide reductase [Alphaproteobacteria bacterium]
MKATLIIIGSGPAGYSAAIYAARAGLNPVMISGLEQGGQLMITTDVENYPGYADIIQGPFLMEQMKIQAEKVGTKIINDMISKVDFTAGKPFLMQGDSGDEYSADAVIICTGAKARWLGLASEEKFKGFGVSACATCDGFFYRNKKVAVIGGGNTAVEEALYLTNHATKVLLVHRRDQLRAEKILVERLLNHPKIEVIWNHVLDEVLGDDAQPNAQPNVTAMRLKNITNNQEQTIAIDGIFIAIGHSPATDIFKGKIDMDDAGYIIVRPDATHTNIDGIFAAGDVHDTIYRQAVTAAGRGCMAALDAEKYLAAL